MRVTETGSETRLGAVKVWDPITRTFHWLLAVLFASAWYSGGIWDNPHLVTGYGVTILVLGVSSGASSVRGTRAFPTSSLARGPSSAISPMHSIASPALPYTIRLVEPW